MLQEMDQSEFGAFVAALWGRQGYQTQRERDDGRMLVAVRRPETGEQGLLWAVPGDAEIGGQQVQQFALLCDERDVGEAAIVTAGRVTDHAEKVASGMDVELLDGERLSGFLERRGLTDLPAQFVDGEDADGEDFDAGDASGDGEGPSALDRVRAIAAGLPVSRTAVLGVVVVVALVGGGVLGGPPIPFLGGDDRVSAASTTPEGNATTTLHVAWNATVTDTVDPNRTDGQAYYAPDGEEFVVVRMVVNNTGDRRVELKQAAFRLRVDGETYGHQPLADHDGFVDFPIAPGQRYVAWTVFSVPEGASGTVVYDGNATDAAVAVEFERDPAVPANVSRP